MAKAGGRGGCSEGGRLWPMAGAGARELRGRRGVSSREELKDYHSKNQRHDLSYPTPQRPQMPHNNNGASSSPGAGRNGNCLSQHVLDIPTMDELEESLRKLKVQVDSLASSLSFHPDQENHTSTLDLTVDPNLFSSRWAAAQAGFYEDSCARGLSKPPADIEWFTKPKHSLRPVGDYRPLPSLGLPTFATSQSNGVTELLGSDIAGPRFWPSEDVSFPLKLGAPHVTCVKSLVPPKILVRGSVPERISFPIRRGRSVSLERPGVVRSRSRSPAAKSNRGVRSQSQSPRPVWRPSSAKPNACSQPPPEITTRRGLRKKTETDKMLPSGIFKLGQLSARSLMPGETTEKRTWSDAWSPYSLLPPAISSLTAQEMNERFLQTLSEGAVRRTLIDMSPYEQELVRLRLEQLRVEKAWLLELKRQQELERTRGPKPKWYEMRTSQFHYEAHKNNELLRNSREIQTISNHRQKPHAASKEF